MKKPMAMPPAAPMSTPTAPTMGIPPPAAAPVAQAPMRGTHNVENNLAPGAFHQGRGFTK